MQIFIRIFILLACWSNVCAMPLSKPLPSAMVQMQPAASRVATNPLPIEPARTISKHKYLSSKKRTKQYKPIWDLVWLRAVVYGALAFPILLILFGLGLGFGWAWLVWLVVGLELVWVALAGLMYNSFRHNESRADLFFERNVWVLLLGALALQGLLMLVLGLVAGTLAVWAMGAAALVLGGIGVFLLRK